MVLTAKLSGDSTESHDDSTLKSTFEDEAVSRNVGIVIPTLNAGDRWVHSLEAIRRQSLQPKRRLVVDSASTDGTAERAEQEGFEVQKIARSEFNHGGTRQWAASYLNDCDYVVFLTQDAVLASSDSLERLMDCFRDPRVAIAYGRQLPHLKAQPIEAHARLFNYAATSDRKDLASCQRLGAKVFFCSNSFAAYRRSVLLELGGFRNDLILGEDAEYAARALLAGSVNAYSAEATVYHSHNYNAGEQFWRYFDTGVFHARNRWLEEQFGSHQGEGMRFVRSELSYLAARAPAQIPRAIAHTFMKVLGYRLGRIERLLPRSLKRRLSMSPGYWR